MRFGSLLVLVLAAFFTQALSALEYGGCRGLDAGDVCSVVVGKLGSAGGLKAKTGTCQRRGENVVCVLNPIY